MTHYTEIPLRYAKMSSGEKLHGLPGTLVADLEGGRDTRIYDAEGRSILIGAEHFDGLLDALMEVKKQREGQK